MQANDRGGHQSPSDANPQNWNDRPLLKGTQSLASELGFALDEAATGGSSDSSFTAALGVPTLDGMGAVGEGAHAAHESVVIGHLVPRTTLLAAMIASVE